MSNHIEDELIMRNIVREEALLQQEDSAGETELLPPIFSETQSVILYTIYKASALLSLAGSFLILYYFYYNGNLNLPGRQKQQQQRRSRSRSSTRASTRTSTRTSATSSNNSTITDEHPVFVRIMMGLSLTDILFSSSMLLLTPWAVPRKASHDIYGAVGTQGTCNLMGLLFTFALGSQLYSAGLACFYAVVITQTQRGAGGPCRVLSSKYWEGLLHSLAWLAPTTVALATIYQDMVNPVFSLPGLCWINGYPRTCRTNDAISCERGEGYRIYQVALLLVNVGIVWVVIIGAMAILVTRIYRIEQRIRRYSFHRNAVSDNHLQNTKRALRKASLYISAFAVSYVVTVIVRVIPDEDTIEYRRKKFISGVIMGLCYPLQGFLNALVFFADRSILWEEEGAPLHWMRRLGQHLNNGCGSRCCATTIRQRTDDNPPLGATNTPMDAAPQPQQQNASLPFSVSVSRLGSIELEPLPLVERRNAVIATTAVAGNNNKHPSSPSLLLPPSSECTNTTTSQSMTEPGSSNHGVVVNNGAGAGEVDEDGCAVAPSDATESDRILLMGDSFAEESSKASLPRPTVDPD